MAKLVGTKAVEESAQSLHVSHRLHLTVGLLEVAAAVGCWWGRGGDHCSSPQPPA
ncbi:hypothetical protein [Streptomyces sp. NPDC002588]|uniref:hypothetical protein n=1 Tax=Streptomyces sp. NPDC002588 TaxID=3154419 RepID=UPI00333295D7